MIARRTLILAGAAAAATALSVPSSARAAPPGFVRREGMALTRDGRPCRFVGANLWYAAWLGAPAAFGDRDRLRRELDRLAAAGVTNLRIAASAEVSPLKASVRPGFHDRDGIATPALLDGLDFALAEIGRRGMTAVLYLTNFWEWSGGMMTYLYWETGSFVDMNDPAHPWPAFPDATARFYANAGAVARYRAWVTAIVGRTNAITGTAYRDDPAILAWQLANEPRPGGSAASAAPLREAYLNWIRDSARLIRTLDPHHLISTGSEGLKGSVESAELYLAAHALPEVDYLTAHIWPQNWGWLDGAAIAATHARALAETRAYIAAHEAMARQLGKPLVVEEFGYPRDDGGYDPAVSTRLRDAFYGTIHAAVEAGAAADGPLIGSNFWAWNGEGRAAHADRRFRPGDTSWLGDPPHEPQGWYGVFDSDATTLDHIRGHARALAEAPVQKLG